MPINLELYNFYIIFYNSRLSQTITGFSSIFPSFLTFLYMFSYASDKVLQIISNDRS